MTYVNGMPYVLGMAYVLGMTHVLGIYSLVWLVSWVLRHIRHFMRDIYSDKDMEFQMCPLIGFWGVLKNAVEVISTPGLSTV